MNEDSAATDREYSRLQLTVLLAGLVGLIALRLRNSPLELQLAVFGFLGITGALVALGAHSLNRD